MPGISTAEAIDQLLAVLREGFEGPAQRWSYFTDHGPEAGLLGTLDRLTAGEASVRYGGTSIAAHAHHVGFGLEASAAWIAGDREPRHWEESWTLQTVDDETWRDLRARLREGHQTVRTAILAFASAGTETMGVAIATVAHVAFHLGAIRQKVVASRGL